jgi:NADH-quinone oxidoreductase subunit L
MNEYLLLPILAPLVAGVLILLTRRRFLTEALALLGTGAALAAAIWLYGKEAGLSWDWAGYGLTFSLRWYAFSQFIVLATAAFAVAVTLYSAAYMKGQRYPHQFFAYMLFAVTSAIGAVLADNLVVVLFFWEGLLGSMFGMIAVGRPGAWRTSVKTLIIVGLSDLCMMFGIILVGVLAGQKGLSAKDALTLSAVAKVGLPITGLGGLAFVLLMIGAIAKGGAMPFHSWIPDAATDAPLPFMAILPGCLEKLMGIYFLARISLDLFRLDAAGGSWCNYLLMIVGAVTILLAVAMALVQKNYKRLLSYHAISQVGYMILGVGTGSAVGIVGGLYHMINNALYKNCLFLTGGAVERQAGTADLNKLGGLARKMPVTFACFAVAALSISGVPPFNGFFSKEMVYDGALESGRWGTVFYGAALLGSVLTAASFLKLGHAAYFGKRDPSHEGVKEAPIVMLLPMIAIAGTCVLFGVWRALPIREFLQPVLKDLPGRTYEEDLASMPLQWKLVLGTAIALAIALINHVIGVKRSGSGLGAVDHIHYAPGFHQIYDRAEKRGFDPYDLARSPMKIFAIVGWVVDRTIDWFTSGFVVGVAKILSFFIRAAHTGSYVTYVAWSLGGAAAILWFVIRAG